MPPWHHHCCCPYHRHGHLCPLCDGIDDWPRTHEEWEGPRQMDRDQLSNQLEGLRAAVEQLNDRIDALEEE